MSLFKQKKLRLFILFLYVTLTVMLNASEKIKIEVFYKERKPSQQVLVKVDSLLTIYSDSYDINYYNIEDSNNLELIKEIGLPETHFPFAIAIDSKFTAEIDGTSISFVHFPEFMHGIGRHEGNWSLNDLRKVFENNRILKETSVLPKLDEDNETSECETEKEK